VLFLVKAIDVRHHNENRTATQRERYQLNS
jgi:hypothetical protein